jgi:hypothetical protein
MTALGNPSWHAAPQVSVFVLLRRCQYLCFCIKASKLSTCALECGELRLPYANWAVQAAASDTLAQLPTAPLKLDSVRALCTHARQHTHTNTHTHTHTHTSMQSRHRTNTYCCHHATATGKKQRLPSLHAWRNASDRWRACA